MGQVASTTGQAGSGGLKAGESLRLKIDDVAYGGDGVGRVDGRVVFVPFTISGEEVTARVTRRRKNFLTAELETVETASPARVEARCPYFTRCGGCRYQHIEYGRQLEIKSGQVEQTLRRLGRMESVPMRAMVPSPKVYGYRNRIRVHVSEGRIGFYGFGSREIVEIERCAIASDAVNEALTRFRAERPEDGDYTLQEPGRAHFFEQTNDGAGAKMLEVAEGLVKRGQHLLIDAYCGAGFFAKHLRELFERVEGIETNPGAVRRAMQNAREGENYVADDVEWRLGRVLAETAAGVAPDALEKTTLVIDPPAAGLARGVVETLMATPVGEILYVSCDVGTMARDLAALSGVYRLDSVTPLDMFPQTAEIEVVARLEAVFHP